MVNGVVWIFRRLIVNTAWVLCISNFAFADVSPKITSCNVFSIGENTRAVFNLTGNFRYHCFALKKPDRFIVDFTGVGLNVVALKELKLNNTVVKSIRTGHPNAHELRIVFELKREEQFRSYMLKPYARFGYRLVVDFSKKNNALNSRLPTSQGFAETGRGNEVVKKQPVITAQDNNEKNLRKVVIVIDPGHGGKDSGAIGFRGTYEKNVVLAVAKDLYELLKKEKGMKINLTRTGDYFVTLRDRLQIARQSHADIFVAIHADAYKNLTAKGASVFALSQRGATSEAARWLAQKENYSELMGGADLGDKSYMLRSVLIDLSQTSTIRNSLLLGGDVMQSLRKVAHLHHYRVEQAPFVVLKSPDIISILVETGFLSNAQEEKQLRTVAYQNKIAEALAEGIIQYVHLHPPRDTEIGESKYHKEFGL